MRSARTQNAILTILIAAFHEPFIVLRQLYLEDAAGLLWQGARAWGGKRGHTLPAPGLLYDRHLAL